MRVPAAAPVPAPASRSLYIPSLDGIRACAVMLVFVAHAGLRGRVPGEFGVTVFFFLSGYLITTLLRLEHEQSGTISFRAFYLRRVLRIFPPLYLVLVAATLLWVAGLVPGPPFSPGGLLAQAVFLTNYSIILMPNGWWTGHAPGTWIFWSLAVEEHFYLAFPLLYMALLRFVPSRHRQAFVLAGLCVVVLGWRLVLVYLLGAGKDRTYVATDTRIDSILFGCILGVLANPLLDRTRLRSGDWKYALVPVALLGLVATFVVRDARFQETAAYTVQGICLFPLFIAVVRYHDWGPFQLLNVGAVKLIGVLSYSIYLMHPAILWAVDRTLHQGWKVEAVISLALTLGLAYIMYEAVEKPATRLRKRLSRVLVPDRPAPQPRPTTPEVVAMPTQGSSAPYQTP